MTTKLPSCTVRATLTELFRTTCPEGYSFLQLSQNQNGPSGVCAFNGNECQTMLGALYEFSCSLTGLCSASTEAIVGDL